MNSILEEQITKLNAEKIKLRRENARLKTEKEGYKKALQLTVKLGKISTATLVKRIGGKL